MPRARAGSSTLTEPVVAVRDAKEEAHQMVARDSGARPWRVAPLRGSDPRRLLRQQPNLTVPRTRRAVAAAGRAYRVNPPRSGGRDDTVPLLAALPAPPIQAGRH